MNKNNKKIYNLRNRLKKQIEKNLINKLVIPFTIDGETKIAKPLNIVKYKLNKSFLNNRSKDIKQLKKVNTFLTKYGKDKKYYTNKKLFKLLGIETEQIEEDLKRLGQGSLNKQSIRSITSLLNRELGTFYEDDLYDDTSEGGGRELILAYNAVRKLIKPEYQKEWNDAARERFRELKAKRQLEALSRLNKNRR